MLYKYSIKYIAILIATVLLLFLQACSDDENPAGPGTETGSSGITMALKTTGGDETEYIVTKDNIMEGEISAEGTGIEVTGWRFFYKVNSTLFASGYSDDNQCAAYVSNESGEIVSKGGFIFENALEMFGHSDDGSTLLAMEIPRAGFSERKLHFVDVESAQVTKITGTTIFESRVDSLVAWPTALQVRGNKLFIPFHKFDALGYFTTPAADNAYIAVYPYPDVTATPEKIITDSRTSNIGVNGSTTGLIETDSGDLYSFSCGAEMAGFSPASTKPSGILRIKSGSTEFDADYFFNVEEATNGGKLFWFDYAGGNKAIARILTDDNGGAWAAYGRDVFNQKLVIIDLVNQTVTDVPDVPLHAKRYSSPVFVENGYAYVSIETATEAYVYKVDIENATAEKGAKIAGKTVKGFYRL
ncbi:MAG: hypothetical protein SCALA702_04180 [Melioribacteraceae bacterium]|nr:MAG: hypothetical protein SCALA702_04180 [Melioribacteraceae bacterium]